MGNRQVNDLRLVPNMSRRSLLATAVGSFSMFKSLRAKPAAAEQLTFPPDFVWGASTSSYQIEGAVEANGRGKSIWDVFSHTPGRVKNGDTGDVACDHYHHWPEDIDFVSRGNFRAYRFSTAWSRVLPKGSGAIEERGLDFYDRLVDRLLDRKITPWLCLYHWDLPQALQDQGGWLDRDTAQKFADYARIMATRLGDRVKHWAMLNEPNVHAIFGHGTGEHAPGITGLPNMLAAVHHQNLAQGRALQALRAQRSDLSLGTVISVQPARPSSDCGADVHAAVRFDAMWNGACLDPLLRGSYPRAVEADFGPLIAQGDLADIHQPLDYLGMNYYSPMYIEHAPRSLFGAWYGPVPEGLHFTAIGWPIDAGGLTEQLLRLRDHYSNPNIYVTENGACYDDPLAPDGTVHDHDRIAYLRAHLAAAHKALTAGVRFRGYFVWSLLDNFEWAEGYSRRFGIISVDFKTLKRTPKASYRWLTELIGQS
jgi:beta-glucosidase